MLQSLPRNQKYFPYIMPRDPARTVRASLPQGSLLKLKYLLSPFHNGNSFYGFVFQQDIELIGLFFKMVYTQINLFIFVITQVGHHETILLNYY